MSPRLFFFFDLDLTLTAAHTGGVAGARFDEEAQDYERDADGSLVVDVSREEAVGAFGSVENIRLVLDTLRSITDAGGVSFVVTRGVVGCATALLERAAAAAGRQEGGVVGDGKLVEAVLGAATDLEVQNPFGEAGERRLASAQERAHRVSTEMWAERKVELMEQVLRRFAAPNADAYFFDDTAANVREARRRGFENAVLVTEPLVGTVKGVRGALRLL